MLFRQSAQIDTDKVAREYNEAVRQERDYSRGAKVCRDRYAEVSRQNEASTGSLRVKPSQQTRFASRSVVDMERRTAACESDRRAWPCISIPSTSCRR